MSLQDSIRSLLITYNTGNKLYLRNLIKEELQNYVLNFVYNSHKYQKLIFTGGTCLRKVYGLNRLSEDLDFDYSDSFDIEDFALDVKDYFFRQLQYSGISIKLANNKKSLFLKTALLSELNIYNNKKPENLFLRCDFSKEVVGNYSLEQNIISAGQYQFFVNSYNLATLFANKVAAFLQRNFYKGKSQEIPCKGRDIYDLFWFLQLSAKTSYNLKPNITRLKNLVKIEDTLEIKSMLKEKMELINPKIIYDDLLPLIESKEYIETFLKTYKTSVINQIDFVL